MTNIGIFDSGLGGVAVLNELAKKNKANYFYLGDNLRVPYGNRSKTEITSFATDIVNYLESYDIDYYIIACNTISVTCKDYLREKFKKEFITIADVAIEAASGFEGDYLTLATKATIDSHYYKKALEARKDCKVYESKAIDLVNLIESGILEGATLNDSLDEYLSIANEKKILNIILACTHYPIIKDRIKERLNYEANIIDPALYLAEKIVTEDAQNRVNIFMTKKSDETRDLIDKIMDVDYKLSFIGGL
ncbi:glutamate racemase [Anaerococcus murdochii]|uniref:Glutamate racemase n=1 Tax=Anaerococcus murdochii TaxID=411577 RepID=A0ABS7SZU0_9FIRM|nr:glutamate racemase [Anaerococcus murdochii]MBZ2387031.1 glutamate racemase [Anaerococcus murdochii]